MDARGRSRQRKVLARLGPSAVLLLPLIIAAATTAPTTAPAGTQATATFNKDGVKFCYPSAWPAEKAKTAVLDVAVAPAAGHGCASLSLDVPSLPPFVPFFISPERVEDGYVKDLRKNQIPAAKVDQSLAVTVCGCKGRCVKCSGMVKGVPAIDVAVILVHARKVYILSCDSDATGYASARAALDAAVRSLAWTK